MTCSGGAPQSIFVKWRNPAVGGPWSPVWPSSGTPSVTAPNVQWQGGSAPQSQTPSTLYAVRLDTIDGATWFGSFINAEPVPGKYLCPPSVYALGTQSIIAAVGGTLAAFSSANINTGPFTAPPSGSVVVGASFVGQVGSLSTGYAFGLVGHGTTTMYGYLVTPSDSTTGIRRAMALSFPVGTLTPGTSYNFDLATANAGTHSIYAYGQTSTTPVVTSAGQGRPGRHDRPGCLTRPGSAPFGGAATPEPEVAAPYAARPGEGAGNSRPDRASQSRASASPPIL